MRANTRIVIDDRIEIRLERPCGLEVWAVYVFGVQSSTWHSEQYARRKADEWVRKLSLLTNAG